MTRRQGHLRYVRGIPRRDDDPAVVGLVPDRVEHLRHLIDALARVVCVHVGVRRAKVPPLPPVHGPKIALLTMGKPTRVKEITRRVPVPDTNLLVLQLLRTVRREHSAHATMWYEVTRIGEARLTLFRR